MHIICEVMEIRFAFVCIDGSVEIQWLLVHVGGGYFLKLGQMILQCVDILDVIWLY